MTTAAEKWGPGPWQDEPDRDRWTDEDTGLSCLAIRFPRTGHWNGYVQVPAGHPWHRVDFWDLPKVDVHWGVNYADWGIDSVKDAPDLNQSWWVGFSCDHLGDLTPQEITTDEYGLREGVYRDLRFVRAEITRLAEQIKENHQ
ncbi:hypothetical protein [Nocardiopsis sp. FR26]|uniref:hypothetical protein n=1 Tax=Nocardiopsis sp. FR26 TaxID=2605987 RepID=UPI00135B5363|nr:hypothetical protein [Nocardiopsis sp. FR26]